jgi:hypothetical protein
MTKLPPLAPRLAFALAALLALSLPRTAIAQGDAALQQGAQKLPRALPPALAPCAGAADRHRFDFWVGEWEVTAPGGGLAGTSRIESVSGGCAILENWTGARGGTGHSLTTYNPAIGQWQQYWIGQDGQPHEYREGRWDGSSLVLVAHYAAADTMPAVDLRLTFTPVDSATVRQHGERSTDRGTTWTTTYDFLSHRRR